MAIESKMYKPPSFGRQEPEAKGKRGPLVALVVVVLIAVAAGLAWWFLRGRGSPDLIADLQGETGGAEVDAGAFQAVFLDNGQVYFGKLGSRRGEFMRLEDVYYMKFKANPQAEQAASDIELVKLGVEPHGPGRFMDISKEHVLFIEDLRGDSRVAKAMAEDLARE